MKLFDFCVCDPVARKKFTEYMKRFEKMETLVLEFEMADIKMAPFLAEVQEKLALMADFKKKFQKTMYLAEALLKKKVDYCYCCLVVYEKIAGCRMRHQPHDRRGSILPRG
jgi:hypothetical protein